ncbi:hypothetical protein CBR_g36656 [Chara braunii]|uniref:Large ribosomal subunit protein bL9c n=1 Tax=Chara braunii TaxID=69332 RepID=A0A388LL38_CHABU|nr:hypothetical protein CBR_g36656 [Chara braunii]|eukprot:GBG83038.1 hypothetical protein CBR_g36656 [Chara braunii]
MATLAAVSSSAASSAVALRNFEGLRPAAQQPNQRVDHCFEVPAAAVSSGRSTPGLPLIVAQKKVQKKQQIILTKSMDKLGKEGDLVTVKPGYFRNYLYPYGMAKVATAQVLKQIQLAREREEAEKKRVRDEAESIRMQFNTIGGFIVRRKQGKGKSIFGSVTSQDIVDIIRAQTKREIDKKSVTMPEDIREVGQYVCEIKLHPEVVADVKFTVVGTK